MPVLETIDDADLLARYVKEQCETSTGRDALGELVRRHLDFVFGVARRAVRDPALAEDITQAVFLILARKAHTIRHAEHLGSWLFQTTRYTAANAIKMAARRSRHERQARHERHAARQEGAGMSTTADEPELVYQLDDALAELPQAEREVILLRFFRGQEYPEIAASLNLSEPAARKRLSRGIERMRTLLARRSACTLGAVSAAMSFAASERASAALARDIVPAVTTGIASDTAIALAAMASSKAAAFMGGVLAVLLALALGAGVVAVWWPESATPPAPPPTSTPVLLR